jgi:hypothetical protein
MSEFRNVDKGTGRRDKEVERTTDKKTGRRWVRYTLWGVVIVAGGLLISGTVAALLWC